MDFADKLQSVCQRNFADDNAEIRNLKRLTAGSAAQTWVFDVVSEESTNCCVLRLSHEGRQFEAGISRQTEAQLQRRVRQAGVPVAEVLYCLQGSDELGEGFIMEYLEGETVPQKILKSAMFASARESMTEQCAQILAKIHSIDIDSLAEFPGGNTLLTQAQTVMKQLESLERIFLRYGEILPTFSLAFAWLKQQVCEPPGYCLVHGDFRNGNFIVDEQGIRAVLDWELSHIGDPLEDLAWLCMMSWRFSEIDKPVGGFGQRNQLFDYYEYFTGSKVDKGRLKFWEVFAALKWGVICLYQSFVHLDGYQRSVDRVAIGRRVSECELNILMLLKEIPDAA